jgi:hypothetical protein
MTIQKTRGKEQGRPSSPEFSFSKQSFGDEAVPAPLLSRATLSLARDTD